MSELSTNIKGLPEGRKYWTEHGYSQSYPWVEIARTAKTRTLAKVLVKRDPEWKPKMHAGGFAAHCSNQHEQTWLFDRIDENYQTKIFANKRGFGRGQTSFSEDKAWEFYDYNF